MGTLLRRPVVAFVLGIVLLACLFAGRAAYGALTATQAQIDACYKPSTGALYLAAVRAGVQTSAGATCRPGDVPISWNVEGPAGQDGKEGVSVTSAALAAGDPNCAAGGSAFTAVTGRTYACNGAAGRDGTDGTDGANGADGRDGSDGRDGVSVVATALPVGDAHCANGGSAFTAVNATTYACNGADGDDGAPGGAFSGMFRSANGLYSLSVENTGIRLEGPGGVIALTGGTVSVQGLPITLNGACSPVIHANGGPNLITQTFVTIGPDGGSALFSSMPIPGSPNVLSC